MQSYGNILATTQRNVSQLNYYVMQVFAEITIDIVDILFFF